MTAEHIQELKNFRNQLADIAQIPGVFTSPCNNLFFSIRKDIPEGLHLEDYPIQSSIISDAKQALFLVTQNNQLFLNPVAMGKIIASLDVIIAEEDSPSYWTCIHPRIKDVSMRLYLHKHYTNAAEDAFIEINDAVKELYKRIRPNEELPDGTDLMNKAFRDNVLKLAELETDTGKNIQKGFHFMFAGAMHAFRNPKAHSNKEIITAEEAMRRIMFASSLMYKLDEIKLDGR